MKIMHLGQTIGGLNTYIRNVCKYMPGDVEFFLVRGQDDNSEPFFNIKGELIPEYRINLFRKINLYKDFKAFREIIRIVKKEKPDIIHAHSAKGGLFGRIVGYLTNTAVCYTPHAFSFLSSSNKLVSNFFKSIEQITRFNAFVLACSKSERELSVDQIGYKPEKAYVWSNSVPEIKINQGKKLLNSEEVFVSTIGRPSFQKNTLFLIEVVRRVVDAIPNFKIFILGVGHHSPELKVVERKIIKFNLSDNIILVPWLNQKDAMEYVFMSQFYISVARYEGLPLAVLEAMSMGKTIIASNTPGNNDCVKDKQNGFLLPLNHGVFAENIIRLWNNNYLKKAYGIRSKKIYQEEFDIEKNIFKLREIYFGFISI